MTWYPPMCADRSESSSAGRGERIDDAVVRPVEGRAASALSSRCVRARSDWLSACCCVYDWRSREGWLPTGGEPCRRKKQMQKARQQSAGRKGRQEGPGQAHRRRRRQADGPRGGDARGRVGARDRVRRPWLRALRERVGQAETEKLVATDDAGRRHGERRADDAHPAVDDDRRRQRVEALEDGQVGVEVVVLDRPVRRDGNAAREPVMRRSVRGALCIGGTRGDEGRTGGTRPSSRRAQSPRRPPGPS